MQHGNYDGKYRAFSTFSQLRDAAESVKWPVFTVLVNMKTHTFLPHDADQWSEWKWTKFHCSYLLVFVCVCVADGCTLHVLANWTLSHTLFVILRNVWMFVCECVFKSRTLRKSMPTADTFAVVFHSNWPHVARALFACIRRCLFRFARISPSSSRARDFSRVCINLTILFKRLHENHSQWFVVDFDRCWSMLLELLILSSSFFVVVVVVFVDVFVASAFAACSCSFSPPPFCLYSCSFSPPSTLLLPRATFFPAMCANSRRSSSPASPPMQLDSSLKSA